MRAWPTDPRFLIGEDGSIVGPSGRRLKPQPDRDGYSRFGLRRDGRRIMIKIHQAVCETYHGPRPVGAEVAHADGNPANNSAGNLRWATPVENSADRERHGRVARGETHGLHRFTTEQIVAMRVACAEGESYSAVARRFGTHRMTVRDIVLRKRWTHVI